MNSMASTIWRRGMAAGAPRRPAGSNRSATSSHCSSVRAMAKLMARSLTAECVSSNGAKLSESSTNFRLQALRRTTTKQYGSGSATNTPSGARSRPYSGELDDIAFAKLS
jgi:hypothetical protein